MVDNWDDSDDEWDKSDSEIDARLKQNKMNTTVSSVTSCFNEEEDLAIIEKEKNEMSNQASLKKKGKIFATKKYEEEARKEEEEIVRRAMELEIEMEENMTANEKRMLEKKKVEEADNALTDDLFDDIYEVDCREDVKYNGVIGNKFEMKDLKDHLKHARIIARCLKGHSKINYATAFVKECIQESKDVFDDDAITDIIKVCNIIKNEKVAAIKKRVKGQAQKSTKKRDKKEEAKARHMAEDIYGASDKYDQIDEYGAQFEDNFF